MYPYVCIRMYVSVCLYPYVCIRMCVSVWTYLYVCICMHCIVCIDCPSIRPSICQCVSLSVRLSVCLSACLSVCLMYVLYISAIYTAHTYNSIPHTVFVQYIPSGKQVRSEVKNRERGTGSQRWQIILIYNNYKNLRYIILIDMYIYIYV